MLLAKLVEGLPAELIKGSLDADICHIAYDSRKVKSGSLFVCIPGTKTDGHNYISHAIENGARALLVQRAVEAPEGISVVRVPDARYGLAHVSGLFFGHPSGNFKLVGITGTKGKTTSSYMVKSVMEAAGMKVGLIGTIANMIGQRVLYTERTTPESYDLQSLFHQMAEEGTDGVVMEVSSQGLALSRVACCDFDVGVFTNIHSDHIGPGEHKDFEDYLNAKLKLFEMCGKGLINIDSPYAEEFLRHARCETLTYGIGKKADISAREVVTRPDGVEFKLISPWGEEEIKVKIPGRFNVYNALAAAGACSLLGIPLSVAREGLVKTRVKGRAETIDSGRGFTVMVDYAHNDVSLENILTTVKEYTGGRVICVFGCGGDRDPERRFGMGEVSGRLADFTVITSDNPRTEDPCRIMEHIETGMKRTSGKYIKIVDRREAIKYAIEKAKPGDLVLIAGKGHETTQTFKDKTIHFDDREVAEEILKEMGQKAESEEEQC